MEHTVIRKILIVILVLVSLKLCAQQQVEPKFIFKDTIKNKVLSLDYFLSIPERMSLPECLTASGQFIFQVNGRGNVDSILVQGNLPDTLVNAIKKRIFMTNGHWKYNNLASIPSKWFVYPVYVENMGSRDCEIEIDKTYYWLIRLYDTSSGIIDTPTSYLIRPNKYSMIY